MMRILNHKQQTTFGKIALLHDTHILDEKSMKHDISEAIVLQGGKQWWLLEHKHCHHLRRCEGQRQEQK